MSNNPLLYLSALKSLHQSREQQTPSIPNETSNSLWWGDKIAWALITSTLEDTKALETGLLGSREGYGLMEEDNAGSFREILFFQRGRGKINVGGAIFLWYELALEHDKGWVLFLGCLSPFFFLDEIQGKKRSINCWPSVNWTQHESYHNPDGAQNNIYWSLSLFCLVRVLSYVFVHAYCVYVCAPLCFPRSL